MSKALFTTDHNYIQFSKNNDILVLEQDYRSHSSFESQLEDTHVFSRPGQSKGLIFKHLCDLLINYLTYYGTPFIFFSNAIISQRSEIEAWFLINILSNLRTSYILFVLLIQLLAQKLWQGGKSQMGWSWLVVELHRKGCPINGATHSSSSYVYLVFICQTRTEGITPEITSVMSYIQYILFQLKKRPYYKAGKLLLRIVCHGF